MNTNDTVETAPVPPTHGAGPVGRWSSTQSRVIQAPSTKVLAALADAWTYPLWVTGASRMRDVSPKWPAPGSAFHHSVGTWPVLIDDSTTCLAWDPHHGITLKVRAWPAGEGKVDIAVRPHGPDACVVTMRERSVAGPASLIPLAVEKALLDARNKETLRRLAMFAENR